MSSIFLKKFQKIFNTLKTPVKQVFLTIKITFVNIMPLNYFVIMVK